MDAMDIDDSAPIPWFFPSLDRTGRVPIRYQLVQNSAQLTLAGLWALAYLLYIKQGFRDRSYGMPIPAL